MKTSDRRELRKITRALFLVVMLVAGSVAATTEVSYVGKARIEKTHDQVMAALLDYGNWCEKGCKYHSPGVVVDKKLSIQQTTDRFFTWTWIRDVKDTKYFSEVTVNSESGRSVIKSRALTKAEESRIAEFERATGNRHNALFDRSLNIITVRSNADDPTHRTTDVEFETRVTVSGFLALFPKKLKSGLRESTEAVFTALRD